MEYLILTTIIYTYLLVFFLFFLKVYDNKISISRRIIGLYLREKTKSQLLRYVERYWIEIVSLRGENSEINDSLLLHRRYSSRKIALYSLYLETVCIVSAINEDKIILKYASWNFTYATVYDLKK